MASLLETVSLSKSFGALQAVLNVNLKAEQGTIHLVIGPNSAGNGASQPADRLLETERRQHHAQRERDHGPAAGEDIEARREPLLSDHEDHYDHGPCGGSRRGGLRDGGGPRGRGAEEAHIKGDREGGAWPRHCGEQHLNHAAQADRRDGRQEREAHNHALVQPAPPRPRRRGDKGGSRPRTRRSALRSPSSRR